MSSGINERLQKLAMNISYYKSTSSRRDFLNKEACTLRDKLEVLNKAKSDYTNLLALLEQTELNFHTERLKLLINTLEEHLAIAFPDDNFKVKMEAKKYRNNEYIELRIGRGELFQPLHLQNGRLCRQLSSFSVTTQIQVLENSDLLIMDEAINSGDIRTTKVVSTIIKTLIDRGYQIILIEHKDQLFEDLPRQQVNLIRDTITNSVSVREVEVYE